MQFLSNSKDILNLAIAVSVAGFTFFLCWSIYYFTMILRQGYFGVKEMRARLLKIDEVIKAIKEKVESSVSHLLLISEGLKKLVEVIKGYMEKKKDKEEE